MRSYRQASPSPARHHPGARSARRDDGFFSVSQTSLERENESCRSTVGCGPSSPPSHPNVSGARGGPRRIGQRGFEVLENRLVPSGYQQINLVSFQPGLGQTTDSNLNGWGMASLPNGDFVVANPFSTGVATIYDSSGHVLPQTITVPTSSDPRFGPVGHPTGVVYNPTSDFVISENGKSAPARLIFDTLDGTISGWNPAVDPTHAIVMVDNGAAGDLYTGLAIARNSHGQNVLYAADIGQNRVEMFNGRFDATGSFTDPTVASFADGSFGAWIGASRERQTLRHQFASQRLRGTGGVVDVFDTDGHLLTPNHFAANAPGAGPLQNPWGVVQAPAHFGAYSGDLLIGNVAGAGNINVYDPHTGAYLGELEQPDGSPVAITGLWALEFRDGASHRQASDELFFDAGPNAPGVSGYGLFGVIRATGDHGGECGDREREEADQSQPVHQAPALLQLQPAIGSGGFHADRHDHPGPRPRLPPGRNRRPQRRPHRRLPQAEGKDGGQRLTASGELGPHSENLAMIPGDPDAGQRMIHRWEQPALVGRPFPPCRVRSGPSPGGYRRSDNRWSRGGPGFQILLVKLNRLVPGYERRDGQTFRRWLFTV